MNRLLRSIVGVGISMAGLVWEQSAIATPGIFASVPLYYQGASGQVQRDLFAGGGTFISKHLLVTSAHLLANLRDGGIELADGTKSVEVFSSDNLDEWEAMKFASKTHSLAFVRFPESDSREVATLYTKPSKELSETPLLVVAPQPLPSSRMIFAEEFGQAVLNEDDISQWIETTNRTLYSGNIAGASLYVREGRQLLFVGVFCGGETHSNGEVDETPFQFISLLNSSSAQELFSSLLEDHPEYFK